MHQALLKGVEGFALSAAQLNDSRPEEFFYGENSIIVDNARDDRLTDQAQSLLSRFYMMPGELIQHGYARAACAWSTFRGKFDAELAQRVYNYASLGWFGFSSPTLSNAPPFAKKIRGLPISCFGTQVEDSLVGLNDHSTVFRWLSVNGGGVGGHWNPVRSASDLSPGTIPFLNTMDADTSAYRQGKTRKGSYVAYQDASHPDFIEFLGLRVPTGDANRKCLSTGFHNAGNYTDDFMNRVDNDEDWDLVDPHDGGVRETTKARAVWEQSLDIRARTGEPYLNFIDAARRAMPEAQKALGLQIWGSNLCNEIHLATGRDKFGKMRDFVCCLLSANAEKYDEWKHVIRQFIADLITVLDNIIEYFIENAPDQIEAARYSAFRERALGLGTMGIHAYLQMHNIAWETTEAVEIDEAIHAAIKENAVLQSRQLATERGEAPDMEGTGLRNSHLMAIAPTANNASIVGTSPGIELWKANAFAHRTRAGTHLIKNRHLEALLETKGMNTEEIWQDILLNGGSVQHISGLTAHEKKVYATAIETNQIWVIRHAAARQRHICQGQSVNVFIPPRATRRYVNHIHMLAWRLGLKGLYYYRTEARNRAESISVKVERQSLVDFVAADAANSDDSCLACHA